ncbi:MAG: hypothetical protein ACRELG_24560 [Gemmataceae bacterium]
MSEILDQPEPTGTVEAIKDGVGALLSQLKEMGGEVWDAAKPSFSHGCAELSALLYTGSAHVMYGHTSEHDQQAHDRGLPVEAMKQPEVEQGLGGREL